MRLKHSFLVALLVLCLALLLSGPASAQTQTPPEGQTWGNYKTQQSLEFGVRFLDDWQHGNPRTYDNFVNLHEGPRLLEQTLSMRSLNNNGVLFDNLFISSFGFGGDPNNTARLKISKNKWYNFSAAFRRDQNFFDYPLLGNPLNPVTPFKVPANSALGVAATSVTTPQLQDSAHPFATRRRMSDVDLTLLPQAIVTFRLGYSRNRITGPSFSSFHEGTDFILGGNGDNTNTTDNTFRFGADIKVVPKTTISFDQTLDYYKNDTNYDLAQGFRFNTVALTAAQTMTGLGAFASQTIDFGLPFFGELARPCQNLFVTGTGLVNPNCSGLWLTNPISGLPGYYKHQRTRTETPSEQLSLVSRPLKSLELSGYYLYSASDMTMPFSEDFYGAVTRTQERRFGQQATATGKSISNSAEFSGTIHVTDKLRLVETFRYYAWRTPILFTSTEWSQVPGVMASGNSVSPGTTGANGFVPFLVLPIVGDLAPQQALTAANSSFGAHNSSTGADFGTTTTGSFLGVNSRSITTQFEYDIFKTLGVRLGYRYGNREDSEKSGYESGTEYYYPNPDTARGAAATIGTGLAAARRGNCATKVPDGVTQTIAANGVCTATILNDLSEPDSFEIKENTALLGLWFRPSHSLRMNGEVEISQFDQALTRVSPRRQQHYRFRSTWQPWSKASFSVTYNGIESANPGVPVQPLPATINGVPTVASFQPTTIRDIDYKGHNRNFGVSTSFTPSSKISLDIAYNFNDFQQTNWVCAVYTSLTPASTGVASSVVPGVQQCPLFPDQGRTTTVKPGATTFAVSPFNLEKGAFTSTNHFVSVFLTVQPVKRLTTQFGYSVSANNGNMLVVNPWLGVGTPTLNVASATAANYFSVPNTFGAPSTLASTYHSPSVSIAYEVVKNWTAKAAWNYYGYNEGATAQGVGSNNFHANTGLLSIRYAF